jgi:hypothetical protein
MYRCYEYALLQKMGEKAVIKEFENGTFFLIYAAGVSMQRDSGLKRLRTPT